MMSVTMLPIRLRSTPSSGFYLAQPEKVGLAMACALER
jgi:hypothetical protein